MEYFNIKDDKIQPLINNILREDSQQVSHDYWLNNLIVNKLSINIS